MTTIVRRGRAGATRGAVVGGCLALASTANAHNSEWLAGLAQHPSDGDVLVLRYENGYGGLLYSRDHGATFRIRPSQSFVRSSIQGQAPMMIAADGTLLLGLLDGLYADDGSGCNIGTDASFKGWTTDIVRHPSDLDIAFILTSGTSPGATRTGLWRRDAAGALHPIGANDTGTEEGTPAFGKALFFSLSLRVVTRAQSAEQLRFIEVGSKNTYMSPTMVQRVPTFRYSDDLGATWTEHPLPTSPEDGNPLLLAVATGDPMKAVVAIPRTGAQEPPDAVLLTSDNGETFTPYIEGVTQVGESLVTPDGRLFIADLGWTAPGRPACPPPAGLWVAPQIGAKPEKIADFQVGCLGYDAANDALFLCKAYEFGRFFPSSRSYCRLLKMNDVSSLVECAGENVLEKSDEQLCGNWCGALHYSSSPVCAATSCSAFARSYDADAGWTPPPTESAPSCTGFVPSDAVPVDAGSGAIPGCDPDAGNAGVSPASDSGVTDAGVTDASNSGAMDASSHGAAISSNDATIGAPVHDGGLQAQQDAGPPDGSSNPDAATAFPTETDDGCDCSARGGRTKPPDLAGLGVALWLLGCGRRARRRRSADEKPARPGPGT